MYRLEACAVCNVVRMVEPSFEAMRHDGPTVTVGGATVHSVAFCAPCWRDYNKAHPGPHPADCPGCGGSGETLVREGVNGPAIGTAPCPYSPDDDNGCPDCGEPAFACTCVDEEPDDEAFRPDAPGRY